MALSIAPGNQALGTNDQSFLPEPAEDSGQPQHCPLFVLYTKKGKGQKYVTASQFKRFFGTGSLDTTFAGHTPASVYAQQAFANANNCVIHRAIPPSAMLSMSNIAYFVEMVEVEFLKPFRNSDGSISNYLDAGEEGELVTGYATRLLTMSYGTKDIGNDNTLNFTDGILYDANGNEVENSYPTLDRLSIQDGTWQPTGATGTPSKIYPIFTVKADSYGSAYNDVGFAISKPDTLKEDIVEQLAVPYEIGKFERIAGNPKIRETTNGAPAAYGTFDLTAVNPLTNKPTRLDKILEEAYKIDDNNVASNDIGEVKIYDDSIKALSKAVLAYEQAAISEEVVTFDDGLLGTESSWYDIYDVDVASEDLYKLIDFISFTSSTGVDYMAHDTHYAKANIADNLQSYNLTPVSKFSPTFMEYGLDGLMNAVEIEKTVISVMDDYLNLNSRVQSTALNPETNFYDCMYTMDTKLAISSFISLRRDTIANFTTEIYGKETSNSEKLAIAVLINARMQLSPESEYFGTEVARYTISFGSGNDVDDLIQYPLGLNLDLLDKLSAYMGAANGIWKAGKGFDVWPGSRVDRLKNIVPEQVPNGMRDAVAKANCIFADPKDMKEHFITAAQTGHNAMTSVLNNVVVIQAIATIVKFNDDAWRDVSGATSLSKPRLKERVENKLLARTKDIWDGNFVFYPVVSFTANDLTRNYSWHLNSHLAANGMMTHQISEVTTHRVEQLEGAN